MAGRWVAAFVLLLQCAARIAAAGLTPPPGGPKRLVEPAGGPAGPPRAGDRAPAAPRHARAPHARAPLPLPPGAARRVVVLRAAAPPTAAARGPPRRLLQAPAPAPARADGGGGGDAAAAAAAAQWLSQLMRLPFFGRPPVSGGFSRGGGDGGGGDGDGAWGAGPAPAALPSGTGRPRLTTERAAGRAESGAAGGGDVEASLSITFVSTGVYGYLMRGPTERRTLAAHVLRHPGGAPVAVVGGIPYADQQAVALRLPAGGRYTLEMRDEGGRGARGGRGPGGGGRSRRRQLLRRLRASLV
jgi:hypothetical protein